MLLTDVLGLIFDSQRDIDAVFKSDKFFFNRKIINSVLLPLI